MKDFKVGDKVTWVAPDLICLKGIVERVSKVGNVLFKDIENGWISWISQDLIFHGHNITVKVEGEELPDRLRTEAVTVLVKPVYLAGTTPLITGLLDLPVGLAKQVREYLAGKGPTA